MRSAGWNLGLPRFEERVTVACDRLGISSLDLERFGVGRLACCRATGAVATSITFPPRDACRACHPIRHVFRVLNSHLLRQPRPAVYPGTGRAEKSSKLSLGANKQVSAPLGANGAGLQVIIS